MKSNNPLLELEVGKVYRATRFGYKDSVDFQQGKGLEYFEIPTRVEEFEVFPKPMYVVETDGDNEKRVPLPEYLCQNEWYNVRYLHKVSHSWFSTKHIDTIELLY